MAACSMRRSSFSSAITTTSRRSRRSSGHTGPRRPDAFQHAGTFNNNVLTMNAGLVGLTEIYIPERARALNAWGDGLRQRLNAVVRRHGLAMQFTGLGSMFSVHMTDGPIRSQE